MTVDALIVSVETGINTVNAEKGPGTLPIDIQALEPIEIKIEDRASRLNNKLNPVISNFFMDIKDGDWNSNIKNVSSDTFIGMKDTSGIFKELIISNNTLSAIDNSPLSFFEGNGDSVTWSLDYGGFTGLSTGQTVTPATASSVLAPNISGLIAAYEGNTFSGTTWTDDVGTYDTSAYRGAPSISSTQLNGYNILEGTTSDGFQFPSGVLPSTYTLFHVTRYNDGTRGRIFDGVASNWLSGFHSSKAGVAYHDGWITSSSADYHGFDWVISTDQNSLYRSNGVLRGSSGGSSSKQLGLNYGNYYASQPSDWQCAEVIVFNRTLTQTEYEQVEQYLSMKYSLPLNGTVATSWPFAGNFGNVPAFNNTSSLQSSSITYNSTGDITIEPKISNTFIRTDKDFNTFSGHSYDTIETSILTLLDSSQPNIGLSNIDMNNKEFRTSSDIASKSPSFCNSLQKQILIANEVGLGYFEVDGIATISDINKNNDPRLKGGTTATETGEGQQGTSGPIQSWS